MSALDRLIDANCALLKQGADVLASLDSDTFSTCHPEAFDASIGTHFRHCIDHYLIFLRGVQTGRINYEERHRDREIESDRDAAIEATTGLMDALQGLREARVSALQVKLETCLDAEAPSYWSSTRMERELDYLINHTVHHYALIAVMLRIGGQCPPDRFGMAPSTLRYLDSDAACAP